MNLIRYHYPRTTSLVSANGRSPWHGLESEFDRFFESALDELSEPAQDRFPIDLYEDSDNSYVRAELPGLSREDISLELVNGYLGISASKKNTDDGKVTETFSMNRSINVPHETQSDKISASFEHGVLTVTLPKREEAKPKKINIQVK